MAQTNFTPILTYKSDTATSVPSAGNLTNSTNGAELAVNTADKRLFTKDSGGNVVEVGTNPSSMTLPNGSANGVLYLNGSKVLTSGSALTFDGTTLVSGTGIRANSYMEIRSNTAALYWENAANTLYWSQTLASSDFAWSYYNGSSLAEQMRLTSTGLGIGTSSPVSRIDARSASAVIGNYQQIQAFSTDTAAINLGGGISLGGYYSGVAGLASFGTIVGRKENGTDGNYAGYLAFGTNAQATGVVERMRLDSSGNLGLGVTPSAWASGWKAMQVGPNSAAGFIAGVGNDTYFGDSAYYNSGWKYAYSGVSVSLYRQVAGVHSWSTAASGTAGNPISFTQAMTLDASGNLVIGNTSATYKLDVWATTSIVGQIRNNTVGTGTLAQLQFSTNNNYDGFSKAAIGAICENANTRATALGLYSEGSDGTLGERARITSDGDFLVKTADARIGSDVGSVEYGTSTANSVRFYTSDLERARIDSSGNLLVGTTTQRGRFTVEQDGAVNDCGGMNNTGSGTSSQSVLSFYRAGTFTGNIANTNAATLYLTSSDYRLKDNTQPLTGSGAFIDALQPKTWDWKAGGRGVGFIAHEVQEVSPNSVTGAKDAVDENGNPKYQSMEYGSADFIANIIAEIQSLRARVAQLETN